MVSDFHVHTEWSWDAPRGSMEESCRRAQQLGLKSIAFTEHADFVQVHEGQREVDLDGYLSCIDDCRRRFPDMRILAGIELGEPHLYIEKTRAILSRGLDRVLGSVHCTSWNGALRDASQVAKESGAAFVHAYFAETLALVRDIDTDFEVLAHLDYPKRYWMSYDPRLFEEEIRAILGELARRGGVLEVNTTRGIDPVRGLCPGPEVVSWWVEEGGKAVSLGSDAHSPEHIAAGFQEAASMIEGLGFRANDDPIAFWIR